MDWAKAYLFPKVKWVDDDREWVVANSFSTKSMQNDIVYFELRGNDRSIHTGVYDPIRGTVKLYTKSSPPIIWMGNVSNIKNGTVEWNVMSGPHIKWTGGSGDRWLAKNWSEICMKYGALTTIIAGGIGISVKALLRNRAMSDGGGVRVGPPIGPPPVQTKQQCGFVPHLGDAGERGGSGDRDDCRCIHRRRTYDWKHGRRHGCSCQFGVQ